MITSPTRDAFQLGDRLLLADTRSRWRKLWDWLLRRPQPPRGFIVTGCVGTVLTVTELRRVPEDTQ